MYNIDDRLQIAQLWICWSLNVTYWSTFHLSHLTVSSRVWNVQYNHFHDQLVLTSSSDSRVILNNAMSISSEPFGHQMDDDDEEDAENEEDVKERCVYNLTPGNLSPRFT